MRLIDADKLPATCNVAIVNGKLELNGWIAAKRIEEAPTVKAIPIEWFKSKIDAILDSYPDGNEETEILCKLLYEWEKENENKN